MVETTEADWDRIMAINLKGTFLCCKAVVPHMMEQRAGKIVNFYSSGAKYGSPNSTAYAATKYGVWGFTLSLAVELAPYGINANCVSPGFCDTGMLRTVFTDKAALAGSSLESVTAGVMDQIPLGRMASPEEVAAAVAFLCSSDSDYVTGDVLLVDGAINRLRVK
jgi:NAD(P)-dependent dehydrogenase (short-subunit alcohol dehydrogenase family)